MNLPFERTVAAHCKVNLTLDVGPLRPDGFHEIDSVVARLSPSDELTVTVKPGTRQVRLLVKDKRPDSIADVPIPRGIENLAHRAAQAALDALAPDAEVDVWVKLVKRLPAQAGLGAGSSDAAAVLYILGEAFDAPSEDLLCIAGNLGSDVAVFLVPPAEVDAPTAYRLTGRGETVSRLGSLPPLWGVLVRPAVGVATGPAYALLDASPRTERRSSEVLLQALSTPEPDSKTIGPLLWNDFESPVLAAFPEIGEAHQAIAEAGAIRAILCGSGSAVWGLAQDREHALLLVRKLVGRFAWVKLAVTV